MEDEFLDDDTVRRVLIAMDEGDIESLDQLDLSGLNPAARAMIIRRFARASARRALRRREREGGRERSASSADDVVRDVLRSPEMMVAVGVLGCVLLAATGLALTVAYRAKRCTEGRQGRMLQDYLRAKLSGGRMQVPQIEMLQPELRILANAMPPSEAQGIADMPVEPVVRRLGQFRERGREIDASYRAILGKVGVAIDDIYLTAEPWALPMREEDVMPLQARPDFGHHPGGSFEMRP